MFSYVLLIGLCGATNGFSFMAAILWRRTARFLLPALHSLPLLSCPHPSCQSCPHPSCHSCPHPSCQLCPHPSCQSCPPPPSLLYSFSLFICHPSFRRLGYRAQRCGPASSRWKSCGRKRSRSGSPWCRPRGSGCRTTCGPPSCGSGSEFRSCQSR